MGEYMKKILVLFGLCTISTYNLQSAHSAAYKKDLDTFMVLGYSQEQAQQMIAAGLDPALFQPDEDETCNQPLNLLELAKGMDDQEGEELDILALDIYNNPQDRDDALTFMMMENDPSRPDSTRTPQEIRQLRKIARALLKMRDIRPEEKTTAELFLRYHTPQLPPRKQAKPNTYQAFINELQDQQDTIMLDDSLEPAEKLEALESFHKSATQQLKDVTKLHGKIAQKSRDYAKISEQKGALTKFTTDLYKDVVKLRKDVADELAKIRASGRKPEPAATPLKPKRRPQITIPFRPARSRLPLGTAGCNPTPEQLKLRKQQLEVRLQEVIMQTTDPYITAEKIQRLITEKNGILIKLDLIDKMLLSGKQKQSLEENDELEVAIACAQDPIVKAATQRRLNALAEYYARPQIEFENTTFYKNKRALASWYLARVADPTIQDDEKQTMQTNIANILTNTADLLQGLDSPKNPCMRESSRALFHNIETVRIVYFPDSTVIDRDTSIANLNNLQALTTNVALVRDLLVVYLQVLAPSPANKEAITTLLTALQVQ